MVTMCAAPAADLDHSDGRVRRSLGPDQFKELPTTFPCSWLVRQAPFFIWRQQSQKLFAYYLVVRSPISPERTECPIVFTRGVCERHRLVIPATESVLALPAYWLVVIHIEPAKALVYLLLAFRAPPSRCVSLEAIVATDPKDVGASVLLLHGGLEQRRIELHNRLHRTTSVLDGFDQL